MSQGGTLRELPGTPVPDSVVADWQKQMEAARANRERLERQKHEGVVLVVGTHTDCGGEVEYVSKFHVVGWVRSGGQNEREERATCSCKQCGVMFNPYFAKYRDQVVAHRNRTTE